MQLMKNKASPLLAFHRNLIIHSYLHSSLSCTQLCICLFNHTHHKGNLHNCYITLFIYCRHCHMITCTEFHIELPNNPFCNLCIQSFRYMNHSPQGSGELEVAKAENCRLNSRIHNFLPRDLCSNIHPQSNRRHHIYFLHRLHNF